MCAVRICWHAFSHSWVSEVPPSTICTSPSFWACCLAPAYTSLIVWLVRSGRTRPMRSGLDLLNDDAPPEALVPLAGVLPDEPPLLLQPATSAAPAARIMMMVARRRCFLGIMTIPPFSQALAWAIPRAKNGDSP